MFVENYQIMLFNQLNMSSSKKNMNFVTNKNEEDSSTIDIFKLQTQRKIEEKKEQKSNTIYVITILIAVVCIISLVYI